MIERKWIQSRGGPLILLPAELLGEWGGIAASDYDRACAVADEVASIDLASGTGLIFGDEPHQMSWVSLSDGGMLVRWVYANSERDVWATVDSMGDGDFGPFVVALFVGMPSGSCVLLDSTDPGWDLQGEHAFISLAPGPYAVTTAVLAPNASTRLLVHRLRIRPIP